MPDISRAQGSSFKPPFGLFSLPAPRREEKKIEEEAYQPMSYPCHDLSRYVQGHNHLDLLLDVYHDVEGHANHEKESQSWAHLFNPLLLKRWVVHTKERLQHLFTQDQFSLLMSLSSGANIRATRSKEDPTKDYLYSLFSPGWMDWFGAQVYNFLKKTTLEGWIWARSDLGNITRISELAPKIISEKALEYQKDFEEKLNKLTQKAYVVLRDDHFDNMSYLATLQRKLDALLSEFRNHLMNLEISLDLQDTRMKQFKDEVIHRFELAEAQGGFLVNGPVWLKVNELKVHLYRFLSQTNGSVSALLGKHDSIVTQSADEKPGSEVLELRKTIAERIQSMQELKEIGQQEFKKLKARAKFIERDRLYQVHLRSSGSN